MTPVAAAREFVGEALPAASDAAVTGEVDFSSLTRLADLSLAVGVCVGLYFIGRLIHRSLPKVRPAVFASATLAILMFTTINTAWYQVASVSVDAEGLTIMRYSVSDLHITWGDVKSVEVVGGSAFPAFADDRMLRLTGGDGDTYDIPRYVDRAPEIAAFIVAVMARSEGHVEASPDGQRVVE